MAKKRGGLAGLYDRNKGVIQKAAPVLAGMVGGPLAGAAVGAAMRGLDREGKSGIGFDVGQGLRGGMEGYAGGAAGKGLKGMFTAGMAKRAASQAALKSAGGALEATKGVADIAIPGVPSGIGGLGSAASAAPSAASGGFNASSYMADNLASQVPSRAMQLGKGVSTVNPTGGMMDAAKKAGGYLERNQQMLAGAAKGVGSVLGGRAEGDAAANKLALEQSQFDYLKEQNRAEQEKRRRLAQMTGQMFVPQMASIYGSGRGNPAMTMQDYLDTNGANSPAGPSQGLMDYVNSRR